MLHTLRHSPFQSDISSLLPYLQAGDALLLIEDGVIAALANSAVLKILLQHPITVYALREDVDARGLSAHISDKISCVGYPEFVKLVVKHQQHFAW